MSKQQWSPEPWWFEEDAGSWPGGAVVGDAKIHDGMFEASNPDARRIVACVNACAGIPTEALEAGALQDALQALSVLVDEEEPAACRRLGLGQGRHALRSLRRIP